MALLRFSVSVLCWAATLTLVHCAGDLTLWKYSSPLSGNLRRAGIPPTVDVDTPQALSSDGEPQELQLARILAERSWENPPDNNAFVLRRSPEPSWGLISQVKRGGSGEDESESESRILDFSDLREKLEDATNFGELGTSSRVYRSMRNPITKRQRITQGGSENASSPAQSYGSSLEVLKRLFSFLRRNPHGKSPRIVSPMALSRSHRNSRLVEAAPRMCRGSLRCFRRQTVEVNGDARQTKKNGPWPSSYLLGGAMGKRR
ncbi:hypothetical protein EGW08_002322 [Elysia chlorotica]|uniref:Uncharacterized protein n=1 Tax=Elysia chlorotica TaxID=188477 RepID=A0A3S1BRT8_ELYCH|nr:hypothetical protein EGW08_002322 [Elysia chlorotica]